MYFTFSLEKKKKIKKSRFYIDNHINFRICIVKFQYDGATKVCALYFFLINLYKILPFITNIIIQKNCVNETCSIRQKKRKEKKKSYI